MNPAGADRNAAALEGRARDRFEEPGLNASDSARPFLSVPVGGARREPGDAKARFAGL